MLNALLNAGSAWETSGKVLSHGSEFEQVMKMNSAERLNVLMSTTNLLSYRTHS